LASSYPYLASDKKTVSSGDGNEKRDTRKISDFKSRARLRLLPVRGRWRQLPDVFASASGAKSQSRENDNAAK
jgi:hypothetical protein